MICQIETTLGRRFIPGLAAVAAVVLSSLVAPLHAKAQEGGQAVRVSCQGAFIASFSVKYKVPDGRGGFQEGEVKSGKLTAGKRATLPVPRGAKDIEVHAAAHLIGGPRGIGGFAANFHTEYKAYGTVFKPQMKEERVEEAGPGDTLEFAEPGDSFLRVSCQGAFARGGLFRIDFDVPDNQGNLRHVQRATRKLLVGQMAYVVVPRGALNVKLSGYIFGQEGREVGVKTLNADLSKDYKLQGNFSNPSMVPE